MRNVGWFSVLRYSFESDFSVRHLEGAVAKISYLPGSTDRVVRFGVVKFGDFFRRFELFMRRVRKHSLTNRFRIGVVRTLPAVAGGLAVVADFAAEAVSAETVFVEPAPVGPALVESRHPS